MEMHVLMKGPEEAYNVRRDKSTGQEGEPLRRQLLSQVLQREGAAEEEGTGCVRERRGDVHK
eukprot:7443683-Prorocentrum_lima.AAC.1